MAGMIDVCRFTPTAGGTTDWTYSAAVTGYQSPTAAGAVDGKIYRYRAESSDLTQWEVGYGAYTASSGVFARTTVLFNSSGTTSKINFSAAPTVGIVLLAEDLREQLTAARTYYVRTDGSDSNTGLANTAGGAFLTVQKAINVCVTLDLNGYAITIQLASGTYATASCTTPFLGGEVTILGDTTTPANVILTTSGLATVTADGYGVAISVSGIKFQNTLGSTGYLLFAKYGGRINVTGKCDFGSGTGIIHMYAESFGVIRAVSISYNITAGGAHHMWANGGFIENRSNTVTISGGLTFSGAFARVALASSIYSLSNSWSANPTCARHLADNAGILNTAGSGTSYFPGTSAGTVTAATFGLFI